MSFCFPFWVSGRGEFWSSGASGGNFPTMRPSARIFRTCHVSGASQPTTCQTHVCLSRACLGKWSCFMMYLGDNGGQWGFFFAHLRSDVFVIGCFHALARPLPRGNNPPKSADELNSNRFEDSNIRVIKLILKKMGERRTCFPANESAFASQPPRPSRMTCNQTGAIYARSAPEFRGKYSGTCFLLSGVNSKLGRDHDITYMHL